MLKNNKGAALVTVILMMLVGILFVTTLVYLMRNETRWVDKHKKSTIAFHLADAGMDRAIHKLKTSSDYWNQISSDGIPLAGYNADVEYTDVPGGSYMMNIFQGTSTAETSELVVIASGRDSMNRETRTIRAVLRKTKGISSSIQAPSVGVSGSFDTHWGPIYSISSMTLSGSTSNNYYPRKWSRGIIIPRDGTGSSSPNEGVGNTTGYTPPVGATWPAGWWEWKTYDPDVPSASESVKLDEYKAQASAQGRYYEYSVNVSTQIVDSWTSPAGGDLSKVRYLKFTTSGKTLTIRTGSFIAGTVIVENGSFSTQGTGAGTYNASVPTEASDQYRAIDTSASGQWPGDLGGGPPSSSASTYNLSGVRIHGFLYIIGGNYNTTANTLIHGAVLVANGTVASAGNTSIYYDSQVGTNVKTEGSIQVYLWDTIAPIWPLTP